MSMAAQLLLTLICAYLLGHLLDRLHMPGGMMIGAVLGSCLLSVTTNHAYMPRMGKTISQIIAGGFIGAGIKRQDVREMKGILKPALILLPCLLLLNVMTGYLLYMTGSMDMMTAMISCAPGGLSDMPMIASDMGADPSIVVVMQFVRLLLGVGVFPVMIRIVTGNGDKGPSAGTARHEKKYDPRCVMLTLAVAAVCGMIGKASPIPAGTMGFATLGSIVFSCIYPHAQMPRKLRKCAQLLSGAYVGAGIGMTQIMQLRLLGIPALILCMGYTVACFGIGYLLTRAGCFTRAEGMLASTPAGASDMALISADIGIANTNLVVLQVLRMITVVLVFPSILSIIVKLFI